MDAIAGLAFGIVVIDVIRRMGVDNDDAVAVDVLGSGVLTGLLMAVIYVVTILMGTQSRGLFEISDNGGIALTQIVGHYFGGVGQIILAVTITFACLKTSIGLVTSCSETFVKMTHGKISYKLWAILFTLFSFAVSNVGLSAIIEYSIPVLMLIYPPATALIILAFAGKLFRHDRARVSFDHDLHVGCGDLRLFQDAARRCADGPAARRAGRAGETVSAAVRPEPRLAAPGCCRLCHRHGDPSFQTRPRKIISTNRKSVKNRSVYRLFTDFLD